jgi:16S rRNA (cytidine1402-2'-O)-methyltransferase
LPGTLFVVATPIGNLQDITSRALETLAVVDLVVCEDTRVARRLLSHFGLKKPTLSNFTGNEERRVTTVLESLAEGRSVALTTDAGTPGVSDPGYLLVRACQDAGFPVVGVPGASALAAALSVCGLPTNRVLFLGFPPRKTGERRTLLESLAQDPSTLVFYESPRRVRTFLAELQERLPDRPVVALRELTKVFESTYPNPKPEDLPERGEYVLVAGPASVPSHGGGEVPGDAAARIALLVGHGLTEKDAMKEVARQSGVSRRDVYQKVKRREP